MENPTEIIYIRDKIKTINNTTTNGIDSTLTYGTVALNVYQIYPKTIIYPLRAVGRNTGIYNFLISRDMTSSFQWNKITEGPVTTGPFNIGSNWVRDFNIYMSVSATQYVDIEYINSSGDLDASLNVPINSSATPVRLTNAININRISWSDNPDNVNLPYTTQVFVQDTSMNVVRASNNGASVITVPNSYVGVLSDMYINTDGATTEDIQMIVKDKGNNIKEVRYMTNVPYRDGRTGYYGPVNYPLDPGDSIFFACVNASTQFKSVDAIVTLTAI